MPNESRAPGRRSRHDLFTPLNHIIGYAEMLEEQAAADGKAEIVRDLQSIASAGRKLVTLVNEVFAASADAPPQQPNGELLAEEPAPGGEGRSKLLIVDDNEVNRDMLSRRLSARGFDVSVAPGGNEALDLVAANAFDVILLDIMMPEVSGLDVLQSIRGEHSVADLPVIMVTSKDASADVVEALHLGANDYVTKPLDFAVVLARIETQLSLKKANDTVKVLNRQLRRAQEKIASLADSSGEALRDIPAWAASVADDLAATVHASDIAIFLMSDDGLKSVRPTSVPTPAVEETTAESLVAVTGMTGRLYGRLVIVGKEGRWSDPERQVIATFARQLGAALELQQIRDELEQSKNRQIATRRELLDRGLALLELCPNCGRCYSSPAATCEGDGSPLDGRLLPYEIRDRYQLVRLLGSGGMGEVFRARDRRLEREVAVKVIRAEHFNNTSARFRFEREAKSLARIHHEGVIAIHDSGELEDGSGFLVMEMLEGRDLRTILSFFGRGTPAQIARLLTRGGAALMAAHSSGLVHRDVKPANIFLINRDDSFDVKLLDFGLAKPIEIDTGLTQSGIFVGTPAYMAPEVMAGDDADVRSDVYSFAAVIYEAFTGRRTVREGAGVFMDVLYREPPAVSSLVAGVPPEIDQVFRAALAKDRAMRPSMEQFVAVAPTLERLTRDGGGWPADLLSAVVMDTSGPPSVTEMDSTQRYES